MAAGLSRFRVAESVGIRQLFSDQALSHEGLCFVAASLFYSVIFFFSIYEEMSSQ